MKDLIIFSQKDFEIIANKQKYNLNKHSYIKITDYNKEILTISENFGINHTTNQIIIDNSKILNLPNILINTTDDSIYCELISLANSEKIEKYNLDNFEINIYDSFVKILNNNQYFCYYFTHSQNTKTLLCNDKIYVFNEVNVLEFDTKINTFTLQKCEKSAKNGDFFEILCKTSKNNTYFLLYSFDTKNSIVTKKTYQNDNHFTPDKYNLPYVFFHLCKNNFSCAKRFLDNSVDFSKVQEYFCQYNDIVELDGEFLLTNQKQITKVKFEIKNNLIVDVD